MMDFLPDSPVVARSYCPTCEPASDPLAEVLELRWCEAHTPDRAGDRDEYVSASAYLSGSAEVGGEVNRAWCDLLHRGQVRRLEPEAPRVIVPPSSDVADWV